MSRNLLVRSQVWCVLFYCDHLAHSPNPFTTTKSLQLSLHSALSLGLCQKAVHYGARIPQAKG